MNRKTLQHLIARTPLLQQLMRQMLIWKYQKLNNGMVIAGGVTTPWVFDANFNRDGRVSYVEEVFTDYLKIGNLSLQDLQGARLLEIGPGETLGVALKFLAAGAKEIVCADKFASLLEPAQQWQVYQGLMERMSEEERQRVESVLTWDGKTFGYDESRLRYLSRSAEELPQHLEGASFDMVISRAVLEHVHRIEEALEALDILLKPGGRQIHEIDFRDHGILTNLGFHPLEMLTIPDATWDAMGSHLGAPNRRLRSFFQSFLETKGYAQSWTTSHSFAERTACERFAEPKAEALTELQRWIEVNRTRIKVPVSTDEDLKIAAAFVVAKKPG